MFYREIIKVKNAIVSGIRCTEWFGVFLLIMVANAEIRLKLSVFLLLYTLFAVVVIHFRS